MIDNPVIEDKRPKNMLTADQAAKKLGMAKSTFYEKVRNNQAPKGYKYPNTVGTWWIEYELDDWLTENLIPA
nr:AlpA family phage regulatory protein [Moraxella sp. CTOTU48717]